MITKLHIENYILIDFLDIDFQEGLNIITGETGAGKSILLGAIGLLLGNRADSSAAKSGSNCVIEAVFSLKGYDLQSLFDELELEYDDETIIRRVISSSGKSRAYINDLPVQLSTLKTVGEKLIDIHSQHQTLLLGDNHFQMEVIDCVSDTGTLTEQYAEIYAETQRLKNRLEELFTEASQAKRDEDYLRYQYEQLDKARLKPGEQEELEQRQQILAHASEIKEVLSSASCILNENDNSVLVSLKSVLNSLSRLENVSPKAGELASRLETAFYELKDIEAELSSLSESIDTDPQTLEETEQRLDLFYSLEQKHHANSLEELIAIRDEIEAKLQVIDNSDTRIEKCNALLKQKEEQAYALARELSSRRSKAIPRIESHIISLLAGLGMADARIKIILTQGDTLLPNGIDTVAFTFSANKGEKLEKIDKVASGGEMSRLMLALKSLIAEHKSLPTIIFDEIDTGVSGNVADKMGEIMERLGHNRQIINITHLPQVASKGKHHFWVYKTADKDTTRTVIKKLSDEERISQIAAMLSGSNVTEAALAQAKELLGYS